jgi:hypothetical protein
MSVGFISRHLTKQDKHREKNRDAFMPPVGFELSDHVIISA